MFKKSVLLICFIILLCCASSCGKAAEIEVNADYSSVKEAALAYKDGAKLDGKTVRIDASQDSAGGIIYFLPDMDVNANIYVTIIADESNKDEVLGIKQGDIVVVTVDSVDNHLENSFYLFAKKYEIVEHK